MHIIFYSKKKCYQIFRSITMLKNISLKFNKKLKLNLRPIKSSKRVSSVNCRGTWRYSTYNTARCYYILFSDLKVFEPAEVLKFWFHYISTRIVNGSILLRVKSGQISNFNESFFPRNYANCSWIINGVCKSRIFIFIFFVQLKHPRDTIKSCTYF